MFLGKLPEKVYNNTKIDIRPELRKLWAEKTLELTNIGAGAMLFSQSFSDQQLSWISILAGLVLIASGYIISFILYKK